MALYHRIAVQAGLDGLWPGACCLLSRVGKQSGVTLAEMAGPIGTPASDLWPILYQLTNRRLVSMSNGGGVNTSPLTLPPRGQSALVRLRVAQKLRTDDGLPHGGLAVARRSDHAAGLRIMHNG